jgi:hypothetical protein
MRPTLDAICKPWNTRSSGIHVAARHKPFAPSRRCVVATLILCVTLLRHPVPACSSFVPRCSIRPRGSDDHHRSRASNRHFGHVANRRPRSWHADARGLAAQLPLCRSCCSPSRDAAAVARGQQGALQTTRAWNSRVGTREDVARAHDHRPRAATEGCNSSRRRASHARCLPWATATWCAR